MDHASEYPMLVRFDKGNDEGTLNKQIMVSGNFNFALDPLSLRWNLFAGRQSGTGFSTPDQLVVTRPERGVLLDQAGDRLFAFGANGAPTTSEVGGTSLFDALKATQE